VVAVPVLEPYAVNPLGLVDLVIAPYKVAWPTSGNTRVGLIMPLGLLLL
jgi:hypothetical protein